ncbi:uncharacterized protein BYT42DRAFT_549341 [Radiomyces spectabilis]|uniref:uncharacterized protein n=1 Tax=Radiomyces spectabilis TaxID=64574 RepID=UPI00222050A0|nr:uncharacterized protein BYT42DRAFT_549341 [Radiomyces spectabilis]KAI8368138.1 hypothetical protein BYT42DRAFT_549341 [Radiomyces spectabilis]
MAILGALPASAEELAEKHHKLFQEYARLKAQHTVLKKAIIKEQATNASLQNNVKEREKQLRKLHEQLDLLAFHNERLTKRIEAVQDSDTKGSHFSLLGGAVKKELEKSTQALDAANLDLAKKIEENEALHEELSEVNHIYTEHVNGLHTQIAQFEKRIEEMEDERSSWQSEQRDHTKQRETLKNEIETLRSAVADKTRLLNENEHRMKESDIGLKSEVESLRAILLAKIGELTDSKGNTALPSLDAIIPACDALQIMKQQAKNYINSLREQDSKIEMPHELAEKLKLSHESWSKELQILANKMNDIENKAAELSRNWQVSDEHNREKEEKIAELEKTIENIQQQLSREEERDKINSLQMTNQELEGKIKQKENELRIALEEVEKMKQQQAEKEQQQEQQRKEEQEKRQREQQRQQQQQEQQHNIVSRNFEEASPVQPFHETPKETVDEAIQTDELPSAKESITANEVSPDPAALNDDEDDEEDEVFVYPHPSDKEGQSISPQRHMNESEEESEDEQVFVYRGQDAMEIEKDSGLLPISESQAPTVSPTSGVSLQPISLTKQAKVDEAASEEPADTDSNDTKNSMAHREAALTQYYESNIEQLTDKLQMADSKALRYSKLAESFKTKWTAAETEKQSLLDEVDRLKKEVAKVEELLRTTESNYQGQVDMMTEYISSFQRNQESEGAR